MAKASRFNIAELTKQKLIENNTSNKGKIRSTIDSMLTVAELSAKVVSNEIIFFNGNRLTEMFEELDNASTTRTK